MPVGLSDLIQMQKVPSCSSFDKTISTENFDLTLAHKVSQLTLTMDTFDGLHDRYDALVNGSICSRRKVKKCKKKRARRRPDPQKF